MASSYSFMKEELFLEMTMTLAARTTLTAYKLMVAIRPSCHRILNGKKVVKISIYRTRAIITRGLYFFLPHFSLRFIFESGLYCREVSNYMNLFSSKVAIE